MLVLVLVLVLGRAQRILGAADMWHMFDHEKLDVYRLAIEFVAWVDAVLDETASKTRLSALRHLDESSTSVALNIAEGNGKRSVADRVRYLEIARGSALECAACLDVLVVRRRCPTDRTAAGKDTLVRIVAMLTKLIEKLLKTSSTSTSTSTSTSINR